jgi:hypothetical protein
MAMKWLIPSCAVVITAALGPSARAATLDTDPHLVGWWTFDETTGKSAADSSTGGHNGTLEGALSFETHSAAGKIRKAIRLDGNDGRVRIAGYRGVTGPRPRTVAAWIKTNAPSGEIVSWGANDHGQMWILGFIRARVGVTPRGGYLYMKAPTDDDAWHHVAAVVHEAAPPNLHDHVKLFKDGDPAEIDDIGLLDLWPIETGDKQDVTIGRRFKGLIDDLRIYDRALSEDEISALFKLESNRPLPEP